MDPGDDGGDIRHHAGCHRIDQCLACDAMPVSPVATEREAGERSGERFGSAHAAPPFAWSCSCFL